MITLANGMPVRSDATSSNSAEVLPEATDVENRSHQTEVAVQSIFRDSPYLDLRHVDCHVEDGVLSMYGRVGSFYLKQVAQTVAAKIAGVELIENHIDVKFS